MFFAETLYSKCHLPWTALAKGQGVTFLNTPDLQGKGKEEQVLIGRSKVHIWVGLTASHLNVNPGYMVVHSVYLEHRAQSRPAVYQPGDLSLRSLLPCWLWDDSVWLDSLISAACSGTAAQHMVHQRRGRCINSCKLVPTGRYPKHEQHYYWTLVAAGTLPGHHNHVYMLICTCKNADI